MIVLLVVLEMCGGFAPPVRTLKPLRQTPVCSQQRSSECMSRLQSRILSAECAAPTTTTKVQRLGHRWGPVVWDAVKVVAKSLLVSLVLQPAIASAAPIPLKYLAYAGYGREREEIDKPDSTWAAALPIFAILMVANRLAQKSRKDKEFEKIKEANDRIRQAEDEFFSVQGQAESDVDIMAELRERSFNATNGTDTGPSPRGGGGGGGGPPPRPRPSGPSGTAARSRPPPGQQRPPPSSPSRPSARPAASSSRPAASSSRPAASSSRPAASSSRPASSSRAPPRSASPDDIARLNRMFNSSKSK